MRMAIPSAKDMPSSPPKTWPNARSSRVRAVSRNVVFRVFIVSSVRLLSRGSRLCRVALKDHLITARSGIDQNLVARSDLAVEDLHGERVLNQPLDRPLHRAGAVGRVVA